MPSPTRRFLLTSALVALSGAAAAQPYGGPPPGGPPPGGPPPGGPPPYGRPPYGGPPRGYEPIPDLRVERVPPPPGPQYIWRPGHWVWNGRGYVWVSGAYLRRQPYWHEWVPGGWVMRHGTWVWVAPHWR